MKPPAKILLVRFSSLGDVIQTLPILTMLRDSFPHAKIGWAIDAGLAPAIEGHSALDYIHRCPRTRWRKELKHPFRWPAIRREFRAFVDEIRAVEYDVAIDAQGFFKTALLPFLAGIRRRIGYQHGREFSNLFYTETYASGKKYFNPTIFHLEHMAGLVGLLRIGDSDKANRLDFAPGGFRIEPPAPTAESTDRVADLLAGAFARPAPLVALAPATQWESKHWPEEHWVDLLRLLLKQTDFNVAMLGSAADNVLGDRILAHLMPEELEGRVANFFGKVPIRDMYAFYRHVNAAIGPDSAPLHVAGAVAVPVLIGIYGPTGYRRTPPLGSARITLLSTEGRLACQPCHERVCPLGTTECMKSITPESVFQALTTSLSEAGTINPAR